MRFDRHSWSTSTSTDEWLTVFAALTSEFISTGKVLRKHPCYTRVINTALLPIVCAPCVVWSTCARIISCTFGLRTFTTDKCIYDFYDEVHGTVVLSPMPTLETAEQRRRYVDVMKEVRIIFSRSQIYTAEHYKLVDAIRAALAPSMHNLVFSPATMQGHVTCILCKI